LLRPKTLTNKQTNKIKEKRKKEKKKSEREDKRRRGEEGSVAPATLI